MKTTATTKRVIKTFENLPLEVKEAIVNENPYGFEDKIKKMEDVIKGGFFNGMLYQYNDTAYLIKFQEGSPASYMDDLYDDDEDHDSSEYDELESNFE